jgi:hypothetical protein
VKFFFGLLAFIAAVVVVILLIVSLVRGVNSSPSNTITRSYDLKDTSAENTIARYTVSGPIVADEDYREIRVTVSKNARTVDTLRGYKREVIATKTLPNTAEAYRAFLGALHAADFTATRGTVENEPRTICVTGNQYAYSLTHEGARKVDTWTTSCSSKQGSFAGNVDGTANLFFAQIPNYAEITAGAGL